MWSLLCVCAPLRASVCDIGCVCFGWKWFSEILFRKCGCLVVHGKYIFRKCFLVWPCVGCKMISVFILPSNIIFRKRKREREWEWEWDCARAQRERERERERERGRRESPSPATHELRLRRRPRDFAPRTHEPIFDLAGEPRAQITPRTQSLRPRARARAFDPLIFDLEASTLPETHEPISLSVRFWFLCDFDFFCCCGGVGGGVLVVFLLCGGGFCLLAVSCGFWLPEFAAVDWIGVSVVCGVVSVVASDGYLAVICFVDWDLAVILKFSVIKFVWMLRK